ncbi:hypothetical protein Dvar_66760 [Desulfosarcina variabilis str. Montpellier]|uniref:hypothetical protein n=1 Tax=Desulfosarcina variabilis TaxID=2300 RepID=UPI003AFAA42F
MRIYHAALNTKVLNAYAKLYPDRDIHVLRAFSHHNDDDRLLRDPYRSKCASLDLDSGTFYLYNSGEYPNLFDTCPSHQVNFNRYKDYLTHFSKHYDRIYNFDCDFGDDGFDTNIYYQKLLETAGFNPVPVVHSIHSDEIDYYIREGYENVALGSPQITDFGTLSYVMDKFKETRIKVHLFGNTKFDFISNFPIYSCDSSVWVQAARFGEIAWWNRWKKGLNRTDRVYLEEYFQEKPKSKPISTYPRKTELLAYLDNELGITMDDLLGPDGTYVKQMVNLHHYLKLEDRINKIHEQKGFWTAE